MPQEDDDRFVIDGPPPLEPIPTASLGRIIYDRLANNPNTHPALIDAETDQSISYNDLLRKTCALANRLHTLGYGHNDTFTISSANHLEFFVPIIAAWYLGAIIAPINHNYTPIELEHTLSISRPKVVFCSRRVAAKYVALRTKLTFIERIIVIDDDDGQAQSMQTFLADAPSTCPDAVRSAAFNPRDQIAAILCSSGTTGLPKGVMLTHTNFTVRYLHSIDSRYHSFEDSQLGIMPFFHSYGFIVGLCSIMMNEMIVVLRRFEERFFLNTIVKYRIARLYLVPPLVLFLVKSPLVDEYDLSFVKDIFCGAAPLNKDTEVYLKKRLKGKFVRQAYGLTEATLAVISMPMDPTSSSTPIKFGSSGQVLPYMSIKLRDPITGRSLGPQTVGEVCIKGPMVMKGYYGNDAATRASFTPNGWLLTGDLAYYDEHQHFYVVDRIKELIKYKGYQVAPAEIEAVLLTHAAIKDVGVVGVPDGRVEVGELPVAFVVRQPDERGLTEHEVQRYVAERLSHQKHLRGGVVFVAAIPKNPSGKILRRDLKVLAAQRIGNKAKL